MTRTTARPADDAASLWPELGSLVLGTVRLHPRRAPTVTADESSLGGPIRWPHEEPWPECDLPHVDFGAVGPARADPNCRYVPVLQLYRSEIPELPFREGTDVFHLLWCPNDHLATYSVVCRAFWWPLQRIAEGDAPPEPTVHLDRYVPGPCVIHPDRVDEYPGYWDLPDAAQAKVGAWEDEVGSPAYQGQLSTAPGTKVGGYPHWFQDPQWPSCGRGHAMTHLLTVSDHEFDGGTWQRWLPIEEQGTWQGSTTARLRIQGPADLDLGMASIYVFVCTTCPDWPIETVYQR